MIIASNGWNHGIQNNVSAYESVHLRAAKLRKYSQLQCKSIWHAGCTSMF
jgi:hypothetical protein